MSIIIIAFPAAPSVDPAAVKQENELNALLEKKVTGLLLVPPLAPHLVFPELIVSHDNDVELTYVHQFLADEELPHLPPGGGLASK